MQYWTNIDGVQSGPVELTQLLEMGLTPNSYVWREGLADWVQAKDMNELAPIFTPKVTVEEATPTVVVPEVAEIAVETEQAVTEESQKEEVAVTGDVLEEENVAEVNETLEVQEEVVADIAPVADVEPQDEQVPPPIPEASAVDIQVPPVANSAKKLLPYPYAPYNPDPNAPKCPPTNLVWAILSIIFCFQIFGIVALVYATQVTSAYGIGDYERAQKNSDRAALWSMLSIALGLVTTPLVIMFSLF